MFEFLCTLWDYIAAFFVSKRAPDNTRYFDPREKIYEDYMAKKTVSELDDICSYIQEKKNIHIGKCKQK